MGGISFADYRSELAKSGLLAADEGIYPKRVIDVENTLIRSGSSGGITFIKPKDWSFHTISHTWSLDIRQLSIAVGEKLGKQQLKAANKELAYNQMFRDAELQCEKGFNELMAFLEILREDGVRTVWFDALCINQVDKDEKSHEILHMGAFYFHSMGCYVVAHGFGKGFQVVDDKECLPRWFSRVWTFQELLLPKVLHFVVELSRHDLHGIIRASRNEHTMAFCACKGNKVASIVWPWGFARSGLPPVPPHGHSNSTERRPWAISFRHHRLIRGLIRTCTSLQPWRSATYNLMKAIAPAACWKTTSSSLSLWSSSSSSSSSCEVARQYSERLRRCLLHIPGLVEAADEIEFWRLLQGSNYACMHGRLQRIQCAENLYFIDRDAYAHLLNYLKGDTDRGMQEMRNLMRRLEMVYKDGYPAIVKEISMRECSEGNDEDRVLSVLALLGMDGKMQQLRSGKTLGHQLMEMAASMAKYEVGEMVKLCAAFVRPYCKEGLSWAPHFLVTEQDSQLVVAETKRKVRGSPEEHALKEMRGFHHCVARVSVCAAGLSLSCHVLKAKVLPFAVHAHKCTQSRPQSAAGTSAGCAACDRNINVQWVLEIYQSHSLPLFHDLTSDGRHLLLLAPHRDPHNYFKAALVLGLGLPNTHHHLKFILPTLDSLQLDVWLLLLGTFQLKKPPHSTPRLVLERTVLVFMVCVGESKESLHKIGIVQMLPTYTGLNGGTRSITYSESFYSIDCTIGGYGNTPTVHVANL